MPFHNLDFVLRTDVSDQIANPCRHFADHRSSLIFCDPDQVQVDLKDGMRAASILWHPPSLSLGARAEAVA
jgi:hypothetical protein